MSTTADLIAADLKESSVRGKRYRQSSSLSQHEKYEHRPKPRPYRRDRVLRKLMNINMQAAVKLARKESTDEIKGA
ncbi:hypothetical protein MT962_000636 [Franconibacter sp. IITDAS19]|uniref:DUF7301 family protein n=1 Tax=Franconibacter sp. IITDAS19 TaxID=2930569 RepID=UPI001FF96A28|nr:hypothetical protein [Franconibacter sp. IITDAS19]MCK1966850.1 hypothetical protein [Franconibacter sp. IITDAS19]